MLKKNEIIRYLLEEIRKGRLKPGKPVPSRQDLMRKFSCARATVDSAVSALVDKKVLQTEKGAGTFVADLSISRGADQIVIISREIGQQSMQQEIAYSLMAHVPEKESLKFFNYEEVRFPSVWEFCKRQKAIVFIMPDIEHGPLLHETQQLGLRHLVLYRDVPESPFVSIANTSGVRRMVHFLADRGCKRFSYAGLVSSRYHLPERRYMGFLEGLLERKLPFERSRVRLIPANEESGFIRDFSRLEPFPDALIVDDVPLGPLISVIQDRGLVIGKDFHLGKFQTVQAGTYPFPVVSLASVTAEVGERAAEALKALFVHPETKPRIYVDPKILFE
jgi:DNA-binding transcriptional regulator YhcF (GntR family)